MSDLFDRLRRLPLPEISAVPGLKKAGREWKAYCPFHAEKSPSFTIFEKDDGWHWKCFGCGKGGDLVDFVALSRNLSTVEAARALAAEHGIPVPEAQPRTPEAVREGEQAKEAEEKAKVFRAVYCRVGLAGIAVLLALLLILGHRLFE